MRMIAHHFFYVLFAVIPFYMWGCLLVTASTDSIAINNNNNNNNNNNSTVQLQGNLNTKTHLSLHPLFLQEDDKEIDEEDNHPLFYWREEANEMFSTLNEEVKEAVEASDASSKSLEAVEEGMEFLINIREKINSRIGTTDELKRTVDSLLKTTTDAYDIAHSAVENMTQKMVLIGEKRKDAGEALKIIKGLYEDSITNRKKASAATLTIEDALTEIEELAISVEDLALEVAAIEKNAKKAVETAKEKTGITSNITTKMKSKKSTTQKEWNTETVNESGQSSHNEISGSNRRGDNYKGSESDKTALVAPIKKREVLIDGTDSPLSSSILLLSVLYLKLFLYI